jgi:tetratricopeptide (TPR) repeat protein
MEWEKAVNCYQFALDICRELEDIYSESTTWNNLGTIYTSRGDHAQAAECYRRSVELHHRLGDRQGEALALSNLGASYSDLGDLELAETCYRRSMAVSDELGEAYGVARAYNNLGVLYEEQGLHAEAVAHYEGCVRILHDLGDSYREVTTLVNVCSLYEKIMQSEKAAPHFERAWELAKSRDYNDHLMSLCLLRGDVAFRQLGSFPEAYCWYASACQYAGRHSPQALDEVIKCIRRHLEHMQQREQHREAEEFCTTLLDIWTGSELRGQKPSFVDELQELVEDGLPQPG